jgi:hypothetical protein
VQDRELDPVDGDEFLFGEVKGKGSKGIEFKQGLATSVVSPQGS